MPYGAPEQLVIHRRRRVLPCLIRHQPDGVFGLVSTVRSHWRTSMASSKTSPRLPEATIRHLHDRCLAGLWWLLAPASASGNP